EAAAVPEDEPAVVAGDADPAGLVQYGDARLSTHVPVELSRIAHVRERPKHETGIARGEPTGEAEEGAVPSGPAVEELVDPGEIPGRRVLPGAVVGRLFDDVQRNRLPVGR